MRPCSARLGIEEAVPDEEWGELFRPAEPRRSFANDLRHVPLKDLASLGGWKDTQTLLKCYLKEDEQAMVDALKSRRAPHTRRRAGGNGDGGGSDG